jgi:hypothetical protein
MTVVVDPATDIWIEHWLQIIESAPYESNAAQTVWTLAPNPPAKDASFHCAPAQVVCLKQNFKVGNRPIWPSNALEEWQQL